MAQFVQIVGSKLSVRANTLEEAKLAIKELKLLKKQYSLSKRMVMDEQKNIRARYTEDVRKRGSLKRGRGIIAGLVREVQSSSRDRRRAILATDLAPLEQKKQQLESVIKAIDSTIIQVEDAMLKMSAT